MTKKIKLPFNEFMASDEEMEEFRKQHPVTYVNGFGEHYATEEDCRTETFKHYPNEFKSIEDIRVFRETGYVPTKPINFP